MVKFAIHLFCISIIFHFPAASQQLQTVPASDQDSFSTFSQDADQYWQEGFFYNHIAGSVSGLQAFNNDLIIYGNFKHLFGSTAADHIYSLSGGSLTPFPPGFNVHATHMAALNDELFTFMSSNLTTGHALFKKGQTDWEEIASGFEITSVENVKVTGNELCFSGRYSVHGSAQNITGMLCYDGSTIYEKVNHLNLHPSSRIQDFFITENEIFIQGFLYNSNQNLLDSQLAKLDEDKWETIQIDGFDKYSPIGRYNLAGINGKTISSGFLSGGDTEANRSVVLWDGQSASPVNNLINLSEPPVILQDNELVYILSQHDDSSLRLTTFDGENFTTYQLHQNFTEAVRHAELLDESIYLNSLIHDHLPTSSIWKIENYELELINLPGLTDLKGLNGRVRNAFNTGDHLLIAGNFSHSALEKLDGIGIFNYDGFSSFFDDFEYEPQELDGPFSSYSNIIEFEGAYYVFNQNYTHPDTGKQNAAILRFDPDGSVTPEKYFTDNRGFFTSIVDFTVLNGKLYLAGNVSDQTGSVVYEYNNGTWTGIMPEELITENGNAYAIAGHNGNLYVAGSIGDGHGHTAGSSNAFLFSWDGNTWVDILKKGIPESSSGFSGINTLASINGKLYLGGSFREINGIELNNIAIYSDGNLLKMQEGIPDGVINVIRQVKDYIFVGGRFDNGLNNIAVWNGFEFKPLGSGIDGRVDVIEEIGDYLFAGGQFNLAGNKASDNIALFELNSQFLSVITIGEIPDAIVLYQNYPNPFNSGTVINFEVRTNDNVRVEVFDITGRRVALLIDQPLGVGTYSVPFNAATLSSGIYLYRVLAGTNQQVKKMILLK